MSSLSITSSSGSSWSKRSSQSSLVVVELMDSLTRKLEAEDLAYKLQASKSSILAPLALEDSRSRWLLRPALKAGDDVAKGKAGIRWAGGGGGNEVLAHLGPGGMAFSSLIILDR